MAITNIPEDLRSSKRDAAFWRKIDVRGPDECWPWKREKQLSQGGYGAAVYGPISTTAHRIAYMLVKGEIPEGLQALHRCEDRHPAGSRTHRRCCNPDHIYPGTPQENMDDKMRNGRWFRGMSFVGDANPNARLTVDLLPELLADAKTMSQRRIAAKYGISKSQVGNILRDESRSGALGVLSDDERAAILAANTRRRKR